MLTVVVALGDAVRVQSVVEVVDRTTHEVVRSVTHQLCNPVTHTHNTFNDLTLDWALLISIPTRDAQKTNPAPRPERPDFKRLHGRFGNRTER